MGIGLYIHVPFCIKKCNYCDFVSFPYTDDEAALFLSAMYQELAKYGAALPESEKKLDSIFIGGGTPTCLSSANLLGLLERINRCFYILPSCEITVEANPGTVDKTYLANLRAGGVNRISLGVQAFQDNLLILLGRVHTAAAAADTVHRVQASGFHNLNVDLIYGIPTQTKEDWIASLEQTIRLNPVHVAVYGLQLEPGTPLEQAVSAHKVQPCSEDVELDMYQTAIRYLTAWGYRHYEVSNFARPGQESVHNLKYWMNRPYLGLGPAAYSCLHGYRYSNDSTIEKYAAKLASDKLPISAKEKITRAIEISETIIMGLRLRQGVCLSDFYRRFDRRVEDVFGKEVASLQKSGLVEITEGYLRLTDRGLPVGNLVFQEFV